MSKIKYYWNSYKTIKWKVKLWEKY
jgi:hypothetical protein